MYFWALLSISDSTAASFKTDRLAEGSFSTSQKKLLRKHLWKKWITTLKLSQVFKTQLNESLQLQVSHVVFATYVITFFFSSINLVLRCRGNSCGNWNCWDYSRARWTEQKLSSSEWFGFNVWRVWPTGQCPSWRSWLSSKWKWWSWGQFPRESPKELYAINYVFCLNCVAFWQNRDMPDSYWFLAHVEDWRTAGPYSHLSWCSCAGWLWRQESFQRSPNSRAGCSAIETGDWKNARARHPCAAAREHTDQG